MIAYAHGVWHPNEELGGICWLSGTLVRPLRFLYVVSDFGKVQVCDPSGDGNQAAGSFVVVRSRRFDFTDLLLRAYRGVGYIYKSGYVPLHSMCFYFPLSYYLYRESSSHSWKYCIRGLDIVARDLAEGIRNNLNNLFGNS